MRTSRRSVSAQAEMERRQQRAADRMLIAGVVAVIALAVYLLAMGPG